MRAPPLTLFQFLSLSLLRALSLAISLLCTSFTPWAATPISGFLSPSCLDGDVLVSPMSVLFARSPPVSSNHTVRLLERLPAPACMRSVCGLFSLVCKRTPPKKTNKKGERCPRPRPGFAPRRPFAELAGQPPRGVAAFFFGGGLGGSGLRFGGRVRGVASGLRKREKLTRKKEMRFQGGEEAPKKPKKGEKSILPSCSDRNAS